MSSLPRVTDNTGTVECEVADNDIGVRQEKLPYIFDQYETGMTSEDGLGLGLTICKVFIEAHGGVITVKSTPGAGRNFRFSLPGKE